MNLRGISILVLAGAGAAYAQHGYTPRDVEEGGRQYRLNCITCHGPEGNLVTGIDLGHGKFRRASSDDDLIATILNGVPGGGMPAFELTLPRAQSIVAYIRDMATAQTGASQAAANGDVARGKSMFEGSATGCSTCHRVRAKGGSSGPDLSDIGLSRRSLEIENAILKPTPGKSFENRPVRLVRKNGTAIQGLLLNEDTFNVQITDEKGALASVPRSELSSVTFADKSSMPSYQGKLNPQELADLIAYLTSLKGAPVQ